jgi:putative YhbY family RNA-binding protein
MATPLSPAARQALKARAHGLRPVVMIGADGLTPAVLHEIDDGLRAHELIKVRALAAGRAEREVLLGEICAAAGAAPVQHIGKILVLYRERPRASDAQAAADVVRGRSPKTRGAASPPARGRRSPAQADQAGAAKRWAFIREEGRPGRAPKRPSKGRRPQRRIGQVSGRGR